MRWVDADRHASQAFHHRYMSEIHKIAVRISHVGLHSTKPKNNFSVSFRGQILGCVKGFIQGDAKTALDQDRKFLLAPNDFQKFEILGIARADLKHHSSRIASAV